MGGREIETRNLGNVSVDASQALAAARNIADRFSQDPASLLELLDALGLPTTKKQLRMLQAKAALERTEMEGS